MEARRVAPASGGLGEGSCLSREREEMSVHSSVDAPASGGDAGSGPRDAGATLADRQSAPDPRDAGATLQFWVGVTGIGMTLEQLSQPFQAFTHADASASKKYVAQWRLALTSSRLSSSMVRSPKTSA